MFGTKLFILLINNKKEDGKINLQEKKNFDKKFWYWSEENRRIHYFYENFKMDTSNLLEIRNKIICLAETKLKGFPLRKKEILSNFYFLLATHTNRLFFKSYSINSIIN